MLDGVEAYNSGLVRGSDQRRAINLSLAGKSELRLLVTDGGDGTASDRANWAGARLTSCGDLPADTFTPTGSGGGGVGSSAGGGGCSTGGRGYFDPTLIGLALSALAMIMWRRRRKKVRVSNASESVGK
jgi:LPXTG-motif cell wall-anchored protein